MELSETDRERIVSGLVEAGIHRVGEGEARQLLRAARRRGELIDQFDFLDIAEVADLLGLTGDDRETEVKKLNDQGQVMAVRIQGNDGYPGFQFHPESGQPLPIMSRLIANFGVQGDSVGSWGLVYWLTGPCGLLEDRTPLNLILQDPNRVLDVAEEELRGGDY
jgi:hypothetical protein